VAAVILAVTLLLGYPHASDAFSMPVTHDCTCKCCTPDRCPDMKTYTIAAGSKEECSDSLCRSNFYDCPDYGAHSDGGIVSAAYHDCTCACCKDDLCEAGLTEHTFHADSLGNCNPDQCSARFYSCPDPGSHSDSSKVYATYHDCMCACSKDDAMVSYHFMYAGSPANCSVGQCRSKFHRCPAEGSHNAGAHVVAYYSGVDPPPPSIFLPAGAKVVEKGERKVILPTGAVVGASVGGSLLFVTLVGVFLYRLYQKEKGYKWIKFEDVAPRIAQGAADNVKQQNAPKFHVQNNAVAMTAAV